MQKKAIVIGSGFAGLSAASFLAKSGWKVTVLEKHTLPGGRARKLETGGFTFDRGPSWYWMPDVFDRYFHLFGKKVSDYYELKRLDPSYRVYWPEGHWDIPAGRKALQNFFESTEPGAGEQLSKFLSEAAYKYQVGIHKLVHKPGQSLTEFLDIDLVKGLFRLDVFQSMKTHVARFFKDPRLRELMEFPVLFLGALPEKTPALYSLMNYADMEGGTWFPAKGMYQIVQGMYDLALELGVEFNFGQEVTAIDVHQGVATAVYVGGKPGESSTTRYTADVIIGGADYHHIETDLLPEAYRSYSPDYWEKRVMAPGCLLYYVGLNKKLGNVPHHSLFFDTSFEVHGKEIYTSKEWPSEPLFYLNVTSVTDSSTAPPGGENLFILIPVAAGLTDDTPELREHYFQMVMERLEKRFGQSIRDAIVVKQSVAPRDFVSDYHSFKGNAYGLANTLMQTAVLKPSLKSKKVKNLFFTGQLTVPGPGVPPSLISGEVVAKEVNKLYS